MGVVAGIFELVKTKDGLKGATEWLKRRRFPIEGSDDEKIKWWDSNIEKYFTKKQGEPLHLRPDALD